MLNETTEGKGITLTGLQPYQNYTLQVSNVMLCFLSSFLDQKIPQLKIDAKQVVASTSAGEGMRSVSVYCRTRETLPAPPADTKALALSPGFFINFTFPNLCCSFRYRLEVGKFLLRGKFLVSFPRSSLLCFRSPLGNKHHFAKTYLIVALQQL